MLSTPKFVLVFYHSSRQQTRTHAQWNVFSRKKNEVILFAGKWMQLEIVEFNKQVSLRQIMHVLFHLWSLDFIDPENHVCTHDVK